MYKYKLENDGIDHLNIYSNAKTELGQLLSNFAATPFIYNGWSFSSVESAWYVYRIQQRCSKYNDIAEITEDLYTLSKTSGYRAKELGKELIKKYLAEDTKAPSEKVLKQLYLCKLDYNPYITEMLMKNDLPFTHYYVFGNKITEATNYLWTVELWNVVKQELIEHDWKID
jgi:hypothetical protein